MFGSGFENLIRNIPNNSLENKLVVNKGVELGDINNLANKLKNLNNNPLSDYTGGLIDDLGKYTLPQNESQIYNVFRPGVQQVYNLNKTYSGL